MSRIVFVDCETTHLDPRLGSAWEVAQIVRDPAEDKQDIEYVWQFRPDLSTADPEALKVGRFGERFAVPEGAQAAAFLGGVVFPIDRTDCLRVVADEFDCSVMVGCNPHFDANHLMSMFRTVGLDVPWHYRPVDVAALAAGALAAEAHQLKRLTPTVNADRIAAIEAALRQPWKSRDLSRLLGVEPPAPDVAHTALGDARWARDVYDAAMGGRP